MFAKIKDMELHNSPDLKAELVKHLKTYDTKSDFRMKKAESRLADQDKKLGDREQKIAQLERRMENASRPAAPAPNYVWASQAAPSTCKAQFTELMAQANSAAQYNDPPGHLTEGVAAAFYNKAMSVQARCPEFAQQNAAQQRFIASKFPEAADPQDQTNRIVKMQEDIC